jgi:hypothetical protein
LWDISDMKREEDVWKKESWKELSPAVSQWLQSYNTNNSERIKNLLRTWHKPASLDCFSLNTALSRLPQRRASLILFFGMGSASF